ncbi:hypothetical protein DFH09DRAFT_1078351 [Mycena vulgaris]|nr:hypothetical protein DFH09DRAFT_1078351 [Mycena vulgaris]
MCLPLLRRRKDRLKMRNQLHQKGENRAPKSFVVVARDLEEIALNTVNTGHVKQYGEVEVVHFVPLKSDLSSLYDLEDKGVHVHSSSLMPESSVKAPNVQIQKGPPVDPPKDQRTELETLKDILRNPPPTAAFENLDLTDTARYSVPSQNEAREFERLRIKVFEPRTPIILTSVERGPCEDMPRICCIKYPRQPLKIGQIVHAHGTLNGYWVLSARKFRKHGILFVEWADYIRKKKVLACLRTIWTRRHWQ